MAESKSPTSLTHYREQFNALAKADGEGFEWVQDATNPNVIDPVELRISEENLLKYGIKREDRQGNSLWKISPELQTKIDQIKDKIELKRQEAVKRELARTTMVTIKTNLDDYHLTPAQKDMVRAILKAGAIMDELFQAQMGSTRHQNEIEQRGTEEDKEFYRRYHSVWCEDNENPFCTPAATLPVYATPLYPSGVNCDEDIKGALTNPFSAVIRDNRGKLKALPFADVPEFKQLLSKAAAQLNNAAMLAVAANEKDLANYMKAVAEALLSKKPFPYSKSDQRWIAAKKSKFFLRIGPDEPSRENTCHMKALFHMVLGIKDLEAEKAMVGVMNQKQALENYLGSLIEGYKTRKVQIETPEFMNVVMDSGDAKGSVTGTAAAQTLPNWCGEDGKAECKTRAMAYMNKTKLGYNKNLRDKFGEIFSRNLMAHLNTDAIADTMVYHEIAHNLSPQMKDYQDKLGSVLFKLEELKAEIGAVALQPELERLGLADPNKRNDVYAGLLMWCFGHIRRAAPKGEKFYESKSAYVQLAAITVGYLTERGALAYREDKFRINYDKMPEALKALYADVGKIYLEANPKAVEAFFMKYTSGEGLKHLHLDKVRDTLSKVPSTLFDYQVDFGNQS